MMDPKNTAQNSSYIPFLFTSSCDSNIAFIPVELKVYFYENRGVPLYADHWGSTSHDVVWHGANLTLDVCIVTLRPQLAVV